MQDGGDSVLQSAKEALRKKNFKEALTLTDGIDKEKSDEALEVRAECLFELGENVAAAETAAELCKRRPTQCKPFLLAAKALRRLNRLPEAKAFVDYASEVPSPTHRAEVRVLAKAIETDARILDTRPKPAQGPPQISLDIDLTALRKSLTPVEEPRLEPIHLPTKSPTETKNLQPSPKPESLVQRAATHSEAALLLLPLVAVLLHHTVGSICAIVAIGGAAYVLHHRGPANVLGFPVGLLTVLSVVFARYG